jgi:lysyl-tRNA synthetase class 2
MLEFYQAYATYEDLMALTEELFTFLARSIFDSLRFAYQGVPLDFTPPWLRVTVREAIATHCRPEPDVFTDRNRAIAYARQRGLAVTGEESLGKAIMAIFEGCVEEHLVQPTFVTQYPLEVSPLSRKNAADPSVTDRFELYICGREIANAFSELNDPEDQYQRFLMQIEEKAAGDEEAHEMDEDYVKALEYGMPPTAGEGIGVDRLVMIFTDSPSIRDVILFPHMRNREIS